MHSAFSPRDPTGIIDVAKTNKGSTLVNTNESSDEEMVQLQHTLEVTLSQASMLVQQVDILQRAIVSRERQTATDTSERDRRIATIAQRELSECLTKVHNLYNAQSSTSSCSSGEDSYSKTGPGPGEL